MTRAACILVLAAASAAFTRSPASNSDPCTLVSQAEAERYLGPLAHAPYRVNEQGEPVPSGNKCKFIAANGRYITVDVSWQAGKTSFNMIALGAQASGHVFTEQNGKTDTLEGTWDDARWVVPGSFFAVKGDVLVITDVSASRAGLAGAADLSSKALGRVAHPLAYDGAKAIAGAPKPRATGDACALLTAAEIGAIAGAVQGAPAPKGTGKQTSCTYQVHASSGTIALTLDVQWNEGFAQFAGQKTSSGAAMNQQKGLTAAEGKTGSGTKKVAMDPNSAQNDPNMQQMMSGLQKMAAQQGVQMNGAGGIVHDTLVSGPWAEGAILAGSALVAVKNDVEVSLPLTGITVAQAKQLMMKVMARL